MKLWDGENSTLQGCKFSFYVTTVLCFLLSNREPWPLDGMTFDTLKEQNAKRNLEDLEIENGKHPEHDLHQYPIIMTKKFLLTSVLDVMFGTHVVTYPHLLSFD